MLLYNAQDKLDTRESNFWYTPYLHSGHFCPSPQVPFNKTATYFICMSVELRFHVWRHRGSLCQVKDEKRCLHPRGWKEERSLESYHSTKSFLCIFHSLLNQQQSKAQRSLSTLKMLGNVPHRCVSLLWRRSQGWGMTGLVSASLEVSSQ